MNAPQPNEPELASLEIANDHWSAEWTVDARQAMPHVVGIGIDLSNAGCCHSAFSRKSRAQEPNTKNVSSKHSGANPTAGYAYECGSMQRGINNP